jgi:hypothetical protein
MTLKMVLIFHAVTTLALSAASIAVPGFLLRLLGMTSGAGEQLVIRYFGASLLGIGLLSWLGREVQEHRMMRSVVLVLFVSDVATALVTFLGTITGVMGSLGWFVFGLYVLLAAGLEKRLFAKEG